MQKAILLHASLEPGIAPRWTDELLRALPYGRRLQIERADAGARTASLAGLALALTGAGRLGDAVPRVAEFRFATGAKPRFEHGPHFSVSHTVDRVACAVCSTIDVGLDIENVPSGVGHATLLELVRWTATEATLKAAGLGLPQVRKVVLEGPAIGAIEGDGRYTLREFQLSAHTIGHVASAEPVELLVDAVALDGAEVSAAVQCALGLETQG